MVSRESKAKTALKKELSDIGHFARRIEDQFAVGVLDMQVAFIHDDKFYLIEAKIVDGQTFGMRDRQFVEALKIKDTGNTAVICLLAGKKDGLWYLHKPSLKTTLSKCVKQEEGEPFETLVNRWRSLQ